jgi:hypothetical protein
MPFHAKRVGRQWIDFAAVYERLISPAIAEAGMVALRADEELRGGIWQKTMFERLVVCEFAVADLSTGNPNVYYELGVRHGQRPYSTVLIFQRGWPLPLDVAHDAALDYPVDRAGAPAEVEVTRARLRDRLNAAREAAVDSPVYQLVSGLATPVVDHARIDTFREHAARDADLRERLHAARIQGPEAIRRVEAELGRLNDLDSDAILALIVAYRAVEAWDEVVRVATSASPPVRRLELVRQQLAGALNRCGRGRDAERILRELLQQRPSSETFGLLGRVEKDRWRVATSPVQRNSFLKAAIDAYLRGYETDLRDLYPGVNAVTLMWLSDPPDPRLSRVLPVVRYAVDLRVAGSGDADFWDHASDLGVAIVEGDRARAQAALERCVATAREPFELTTTAETLEELHDAATSRSEDAGWIAEAAAVLRATTLP